MSLEDNINEYLKQYAVVKEIKEKLDEQDKEIERLNNIIKEVRDILEPLIALEGTMTAKGMSKLLEILDKGKE